MDNGNAVSTSIDVGLERQPSDLEPPVESVDPPGFDALLGSWDQCMACHPSTAPS